MLDNFKELLKYSGLLRALVVRHLAVRYRGSVLGFLWSFLNPLMLMTVYMIVFRYYIRYNDVSNYSIFLFCGLLPWIWFQSTVIEGSYSIISSGHLITKSMFPPQLLPVVTVVVGLINYLLSLILLFLIMLCSGQPLHWTWLLLPILILTQFIFLVGITLIIGTLNVFYRDVQHIVANILTFLFFLLPVLYPAKAVPEKWRFTLDFNPVAVLIVCYHDLLLDGVIPSVFHISVILVSAIASLWIGNRIFTNYRERFAELL